MHPVGLKQINHTEKEICSCSKAVYLAHDHVTSSMGVCSESKRAISRLVSESQCLQVELLNAGVNQMVQEEYHAKCRMMLNRYGLRTKELEKTLPLQKELESLSSTVEDLKAHSMFA